MVKRRVLDRHISKYHELHPLRLPPGIKVLVAYTGIIALLYFAYLLFGKLKPVSVIFGKLIYGPLAVGIETLGLLVLLAIIYGLIKRHYWVFYVSLTWFSFGVLNAIISLISFKSEFDVLRTVLIISSFVVIILNGLIVWYVYSEKEYFKVKHLNKETKAKDKFFVYVISVFLIVSLLMLITFGLNFYRTTIKTTDRLVAELNESPIPDLLCAQKIGSEKDLCYLILSIKQGEMGADLCENIASDFYKITCYRAMQ